MTVILLKNLGALHRLMSEISFDTVEVETSDFYLKVKMVGNIFLSWRFGEEDSVSHSIPLPFFDLKNVENLEFRMATVSKSSLFFPTFRRIEGGFSTSRSPGNFSSLYALQNAMSDVSTEMSTDNHRFVASISTHELVELLTQTRADISEHISTSHIRLSTFITKSFHDYSTGQEKTETENLKRAVSIFNEIQAEVDRTSKEREDLLRPFTVLSELVGKIFQYNGIRITERITLGEAKETISSEVLSSGEKQMLSFLCYNAFMKNSTIFIDEPELSLHVDWQRLLFPTLLKQGTGNQFIVATHSPFIYSKYPDKELVLDTDKGGY
ncbi:ATP-binding protein [Candidatus Poribacteria bacterium]|nr:ATP-binding protein [Candidatus Poribacteria bacterium]